MKNNLTTEKDNKRLDSLYLKDNALANGEPTIVYYYSAPIHTATTNNYIKRFTKTSYPKNLFMANPMM